MKIVINTSYGGISSQTAALRRNPQFIEDVLSGRFAGRVNFSAGFAETLRVVEIPDDVSDYKIINYDGAEGIIYVQDGNLCYVGSDEAKCIFDNNETF